MVGLLLLVLATGCGMASDGRASVSGTVTVDDQPLETGSLTLVPIEGTKGPSAGGEIEGGQFSIDTSEGPMPGTYRVRIIAMRKTGRKIKDEFAGSPNQMVDQIEQFLPARYNRQSELTIEVESGENRDIRFDLYSGG